ncbi:MAG: crossover junction endodeoxyribonuclease RuvC [Peptococcaceae bacterium]|nr:crossover junction endodeoxyribonuclease RuvC [Peptococcaceae bacterium]
MIIMGIDPGTALMGYGIVHYSSNHFKPLTYGVLRTYKGEGPGQRLKILFEGLNRLMEEHRPEHVAVEALFFNKNITTALPVGQARGVALLSAALRELPIFEYTPLQVKQGVVGYGRADKSQIQFMVRAILNLKEIPKPDDAADALAVAICHGNSVIMNQKIGGVGLD